MTFFMEQTWLNVWDAFCTTVMLAASSLVITALLSGPVALALKAGAAWASTFVDLATKVPLIIKLFICFYIFRMDPIACAVFSLVIHQVGYCSEIIRGGLLAVPKEYEEAAITTGLSRLNTVMSIQLPIALRVVSPSLVIQAAEAVKNTAIVSLIGVVELTGAVETVQSQTYEYASGFIAAALAYASLTIPLMAVGNLLERRMARAG